MTVNMRIRIVTYALVGLSVGLLVLRFEATASFPGALPILAAGSKLPSPKGYRWDLSRSNLVFVLHVGCPHCENEMTFYEELLRLSRDNRIHSRIVAFFPDSEAQVGIAFPGRLIGLTKLADVDLAPLRVRGTPTLIVVDDSGIVRSVWTGELTADQKQSVIMALRSEN
jgi:hypothetical protein